jgi:hypothetical protein
MKNWQKKYYFSKYSEINFNVLGGKRRAKCGVDIQICANLWPLKFDRIFFHIYYLKKEKGG